MSLESKTAYWVNLGINSYQETATLQQQLVCLRKKGKTRDIILVGQHYPEVNFGSSEPDNLYSDQFLEL
jgi:lipoate-protein ligase B